MPGSILILLPVVALYAGESTTVAPAAARLAESRDGELPGAGAGGIALAGVGRAQLRPCRGTGFSGELQVKTHYRYVSGRLDVQSRAAVAVALRRGMVGLEEA
jgi:hypothetical protein